MSEREGVRVQIILSNNFSYTGVILSEDEFFIVIRDKFNERVSIGKKDIQIIKEVANNGN
jgi:sRNA-binding regulator protein Hfq